LYLLYTKCCVIVSFVSIHTKRVPEVNLRVKRLIEDLFNLQQQQHIAGLGALTITG